MGAMELVSWSTQQVQVLKRKNTELAGDRLCGETTLRTLHTVSKVETLATQSSSVVDKEDWPAFTELLVKKLVRNGAQSPEEELRSGLQEAALSRDHAVKTFDLSLNYEAGGSQFVSCVKFASRRKLNGQIMIMYSQYGKRWIERKEYRLNRKFWERAPNPARLMNFLEHGANDGFQKPLLDDEVQQSMEEE